MTNGLPILPIYGEILIIIIIIIIIIYFPSGTVIHYLTQFIRCYYIT